jgi:general secretion pathway protein H
MRGYTLIEILIVLFIISIVSSVAMLSIGRSENKEIESFANEVMQMMSLAEEQAMLQPVVLGLTANDHVLQFASFGKNTWTPFQDTILGKHVIPNAIRVAIDVGEHVTSEKKTPQIIVSTNGDVTPFTIYIGKKGEKPRYAVIGDADGNITRKELS